MNDKNKTADTLIRALLHENGVSLPGGAPASEAPPAPGGDAEGGEETTVTITLSNEEAQLLGDVLDRVAPPDEGGDQFGGAPGEGEGDVDPDIALLSGIKDKLATALCPECPPDEGGGEGEGFGDEVPPV